MVCFYILVCNRSMEADIVFVVSGNSQIVSDIVRRLKVGQDATRVGLVSYGNRIRVHFQLDAYPTESSIRRILNSFSRTRHHISVDEAIEVMRTRVFTQSGDRPDIQNFAIVLLDGNMNMSNDFPKVKLAKEDGITMLAIGNGVTNRVLSKISSTGVQGESYWSRAPRQGEINDVIENVLCQMQTYRFRGSELHCINYFFG